MIVLNHLSAVKSTAAVRILLDELGVPFSEADEAADVEEKAAGDALIAPFACLPSLLACKSAGSPPDLNLAPSLKRLFLHSYDPASCPDEAIRDLIRVPRAKLSRLNSRPIDCVCAEDSEAICGPLTGLSVCSVDATESWGMPCPLPHWCKSVISSEGAALLLQVQRNEREIFLLFTATLADLGEVVTRNVDIQERLLSLAAPLMVVKHLAQGRGWNRENGFANVIIDDPPLTLKYGFIDFRRLVDRVARADLRVTLAFIPWNCRRGGRRAVRFFKDASDRLSLCVHGCNHTAREFGTTDETVLDALTSLADERANTFTERTSIACARVMVFPQGVFSARAMLALKRAGWPAAVNTELLDVTEEQTVTIRDLLQPAVTAYHGYPLFLRRKPGEGVQNLAFDLLLGKPALIVTHHHDYRIDDAPVWNLAERVNRLAGGVDWRPLSEIVTRSVGYRETSTGAAEACVDSNLARLSGLSGFPDGRPLLVRKREPDPDMIESVLVSGRPVEWDHRDGHVVVAIEGEWKDSEIRLVYREPERTSRFEFPLDAKLKAGLRRVLCEVRDNHVMKSRVLRRLFRLSLDS